MNLPGASSALQRDIAAEHMGATIPAGASGDVHRLGGLSAARVALAMLADPVKCMETVHRQYGDAIAIDLFFRPKERRTRALLLIGPRYNRYVLTNDERFRPHSLFPARARKGTPHADLQKGFITTHGAEHDALAKASAQHLYRKRVEGYFDQIRTIGLDEISQWPVGVPVNLLALCRHFAQHVALKLVFGEQSAEKRDEFSRLLSDYHVANWSPFAFLFPFDFPGSPYRRVMQRAKKLQDFIIAWLEERRSSPADSDVRAAFAQLTDGLGNPLPVEKIAGHLSFFGFAAYETISSALTWALILLELQPQTKHDLLDELAAHPSIEDIDYKALSTLPLLDAVVKETLRLLPPTPSLPFKVIDSGEIDGIPARRGTPVILSPHLTHRMPDIYSDPKRFMPQRWFSIDPSPYEYMPFGGGRRFCPGHWLAVEWIKIGLAVVLPRYRIALPPGARIDRVFRGVSLPSQNIPASLAPQDRVVRKNGGYRGSLFDIISVH